MSSAADDLIVALAKKAEAVVKAAKAGVADATAKVNDAQAKVSSARTKVNHFATKIQGMCTDIYQDELLAQQEVINILAEQNIDLNFSWPEDEHQDVCMTSHCACQCTCRYTCQHEEDEQPAVC